MLRARSVGHKKVIREPLVLLLKNLPRKESTFFINLIFFNSVYKKKSLNFYDKNFALSKKKTAAIFFYIPTEFFLYRVPKGQINHIYLFPVGVTFPFKILEKNRFFAFWCFSIWRIFFLWNYLFQRARGKIFSKPSGKILLK